MDVIEQLCIKSHTVCDAEGTTFSIKQGNQYTTTKPKRGQKTVTVFSRYWAPMPKTCFVPMEQD